VPDQRTVPSFLVPAAIATATLLSAISPWHATDVVHGRRLDLEEALSMSRPAAAPSGDAEAAAPPHQGVLDENQMIVFYGTPLSDGMGILGMFEPDDAARRVRDQAAVFDAVNGDRGAIGAMDLIYAMAQSEPTGNGLYLRYLDDETVQRYLDAAEANDVQLMLDLQIGRGDVLEEVKKVERFLLNPRVHVAIDPEYAVGPYGEPIVTPGVITGDQINQVQQYLADLASANKLPPKVLVVHQYMDDTIVDGDAAAEYDRVDLVINMDAFGPDDAKLKKYRHYARRPYSFHDAYNIFLRYDDRVMGEQEVANLDPQPDAVFYQ
jgi:hypothetical protein